MGSKKSAKKSKKNNNINDINKEISAAESSAEEVASEVSDASAETVEETVEETVKETVEETVKETAEETVEETKTEEPAGEDVSSEATDSSEVSDAADETTESEETDESEDSGKPKVSVFFDIMRVIFIAVFVVALGALSHIAYEYLKGVEISQRIKNTVIDTKPTVVSERPDRITPIYPGTMTPVVTYPDIITKEKLQYLKSENSDFRLWFYIEGTDISYPVLYSGDNDFYLKRDFYKQSNISGSLFLDFRNTSILGNTIIYGHNMKNGTMFGSLKSYADEAFFRHHTMIYTYSETEIIAWQIFSVYPTDIYNNYIKTSFRSNDEYYEFIKSLQNDSLFTTDIELKPSDNILTLSTCRNGEGNRFVVHAKKVYTFTME